MTKRDKQIEYLSDMSDKEALRGLGSNAAGYCITNLKTKKQTFCQCADTALMLLSTEFKDVDVWIKRAFTPSQIKG